MVVAVAVVAVISVQPTSEKRTVPQLSGSAAKALPAVRVAMQTAPASVNLRESVLIIVVVPLPCVLFLAKHQ